MLSKNLTKVSNVAKNIRTNTSKPKIMFEAKNEQKVKDLKPEDFKIEYGRLF